MDKKSKGFIIFLVIVCIACMATAFYISRYKLVVFPIEGESMEPNVHDGDKVLVYRTKNIKHGDVVVFNSEAYDKCLIKRVIGLEGDRIEIKYHEGQDIYQIYRNGVRLDEDYINEPITRSYYEMDIVVPENKMFFLGDNRNWSLDSHSGEVMDDVSLIEGKVIMRYKGLNFTFLEISA
ncbi:MAG: signal peptidase I [Clostridia bacterium]|nr:signal peptidase I [Clostridia bacterium]